MVMRMFIPLLLNFIETQSSTLLPSALTGMESVSESSGLARILGSYSVTSKPTGPTLHDVRLLEDHLYFLESVVCVTMAMWLPSLVMDETGETPGLMRYSSRGVLKSQKQVIESAADVMNTGEIGSTEIE